MYLTWFLREGGIRLFSPISFHKKTEQCRVPLGESGNTTT
ncbi:hypothetical protein ACZ87_02942 [Candidatus Erwinia dacicola]|uniref:Uncharacterized protein n=1 Tax=Candidatus Erwinia dacicola TaxID=252393 RepID=A0A328TMQ0_9GAMM|nr:hypothetical protein ACZ87_02942 [Candidatus Erwinia dacicola]